ncbi:ComF family protein [Mongoliitalea daihaiensis]|uniref:ComF family protein n=1 Tax=Mongoliitalea daihaiensis TaxID=2782006 RepID=UPI001F1FF6C0|nr:ComF family protein [Mongoliitalea daihaiensis]UJP65928.1 ComF family protein [Mongoliitalea daihaiensis]
MRFNIVEDFLSLVFPRTCAGCSRSLFDFEHVLCKVCEGALPITDYHLRPQNNDLVIKVTGLMPVYRVMSFLRFTKKGMSQRLLHQLKYKNKPDIGVTLGKLYGQLLIQHSFADAWDQITPVPLHPSKQKRRGYNQSEQFGKGLADSLQIPLVNSLIRSVNTETQTRKSRSQRLDNVENVFQVVNSVENKRVLLVDDVMTTGATLVACANSLLEAKASMVDLAVIAAGKMG